MAAEPPTPVQSTVALDELSLQEFLKDKQVLCLCISDLHFGAKGRKKKFMGNFLHTIREVHEQVTSGRNPYDVPVLVLGDIVDNRTRKNFNEIKELFVNENYDGQPWPNPKHGTYLHIILTYSPEEGKFPWLFIPGNHDTYYSHGLGGSFTPLKTSTKLLFKNTKASYFRRFPDPDLQKKFFRCMSSYFF